MLRAAQRERPSQNGEKELRGRKMKGDDRCCCCCHATRSLIASARRCFFPYIATVCNNSDHVHTWPPFTLRSYAIMMPLLQQYMWSQK